MWQDPSSECLASQCSKPLIINPDGLASVFLRLLSVSYLDFAVFKRDLNHQPPRPLSAVRHPELSTLMGSLFQCQVMPFKFEEGWWNSFCLLELELKILDILSHGRDVFGICLPLLYFPFPSHLWTNIYQQAQKQTCPSLCVHFESSSVRACMQHLEPTHHVALPCFTWQRKGSQTGGGACHSLQRGGSLNCFNDNYC